MKFHIEPTENPSILKFIADQMLVETGSYEYSNIDEAGDSEVAQKLFHFPFVKKVYITANFIAVQRYEITTWPEVAEAVKEELEQLTEGRFTLVEAQASPLKKHPITVYSEMTPNPAVMKFVSNIALIDGILEYKDAEQAQRAPLASALFSFAFVKEVFLSENYLSVTKHDTTAWNEVVMPLREFILAYLRDGKPILKPTRAAAGRKSADLPLHKGPLNETEKLIVGILEKQVKPAVASDGGNIEFLKYDAAQKRVEVLLQGACSGCPSSSLTLKQGIETLLKQELPHHIERVEAYGA